MAKKVITFTVQPPCSTASRKQPTSLHILSGSLLKFHFILIEFDFKVSCIKDVIFFFFSFVFYQDYIWWVNHYQKQTHHSMKTTAFLRMVKHLHYFSLV